MKITTRSMLIGLLLIGMSSTYAAKQPLVKAQRNCPQGGDVYIQKGSMPQSSTCVWLPDDDEDISVTLHVSKNVDFVYASCTFVPATSSEGENTDSVADVRVSKAGTVDGAATPPVSLASGYQIINGNNIQALLRNYNSSFDDNTNDTVAHLNVLFYLNNVDYTPNDMIKCTFVPVTPAQ